MFSSTLQVLKVEREERFSKRTQKNYNHFAARCILFGDDGEVINVGSIRSDRVTPELRDMVQPGTYRATFGLQVPDFGEDKGDIVTVLTGLTPVVSKQAPAPKPDGSK